MLGEEFVHMELSGGRIRMSESNCFSKLRLQKQGYISYQLSCNDLFHYRRISNRLSFIQIYKTCPLRKAISVYGGLKIGHT